MIYCVGTITITLIIILPGYLKIRSFKPGSFIGYGEWDKFILGITYIYIPLGISFSK